MVRILRCPWNNNKWRVLIDGLAFGPYYRSKRQAQKIADYLEQQKGNKK